MNKFVHAGYWIVVIILIVVAVNIGASLDSERSKRIELEAEIDRHICKVVHGDTLLAQLWPTERFNVPLQEMFDRGIKISFDSLLAVPPKDSMSVTNVPLLNSAGDSTGFIPVYHRGKLIVDSSEVTE